ncbi:hypothetical protein CROQUDRAFT_657226 [Cronartium quercuum f. sp. fusiforme G11]|uniref:Protein-serine/threonine kinase n=1 Tax=Cronartium quercuum f. sp. fusiforme G11 TaxID=708437 RepID=A0A9P6NIF7_9BASI|nr:hypothetical protein CROQUDRAFT_657226 [Cronartium quercuum f. sp. fusiforme G11]
MLGWLIRRHLHSSPLKLLPPAQPGKFYGNSHIFRYAAMDSIGFSLRQLIFFGKMLWASGFYSEADSEQRLVRGANFVKSQLPVRIARRIRDIQSLPFIVASNPNLNAALKLYVEAFEKLRSYPPICNCQDNQRWCEFLEKILDQHRIVIPQLAIGIAESSDHLTPHQIDSFMTRMLQSRISRRVLAQHHIALTSQFHSAPQLKRSKIGVVDIDLRVADGIEKCIRLAQATLGLKHSPGSEPVLDVMLTGEQDARFAYIADQLEYIMFELLLNSFKATLKHAHQRALPPAHFPISIHIVSSPTQLTIRLSDHAGGIRSAFSPSLSDEDDFPPSVTRRELFSFSHLAKRKDRLKGLIKTGGLTGTVGEQVQDNGSSTMGSTEEEKEVQEARLRIGLPLSSIYAQFFGGSLEMYSIEGSADAVLRIPKLGTTTE